MQRGDGGYMRVVAGMPDANARLPASANRRLKEEERRALVIRLREQGWSYRRISDELNISYAVVSRWLDGDDMATPPLTPLPIRVTLVSSPQTGDTVREGTHTALVPQTAPPRPMAPESPAPLLEHLVAQNRALMHRVDQLVAAEAARKQAMNDLELRLVANIEEQHKRLGERLFDSIKSLLRKFSRG
ncbi:helix-turn-helix domain-containing protein [Azospirillum griseum]|uniref:Helix-turn-helix domain-containing protein n=1 Tax=Azospirillum griseum TaxID=2496639 RepID=A0A431VMB1_9PROT|nr:helix-turn-helix domain-containing protein [Azospirillum griseum]RTR22925.1 helix-turn-helix domain-containing protein [Azospirillum griseum]